MLLEPQRLGLNKGWPVASTRMLYGIQTSLRYFEDVLPIYHFRGHAKTICQRGDVWHRVHLVGG